jgi:hypothetical protein
VMTANRPPGRFHLRSSPRREHTPIGVLPALGREPCGESLGLLPLLFAFVHAVLTGTRWVMERHNQNEPIPEEHGPMIEVVHFRNLFELV